MTNDSKAAGTDKRIKRRNPGKYKMIFPLIVILAFMIAMVLYTSRTLYNVAVSNIREVGEDRLANVSA